MLSRSYRLAVAVTHDALPSGHPRLTYLPEELDDASKADHEMMLNHIASVFGHSAAAKQAATLGIGWKLRALNH